jgi:hypothetical protein
MERVRFNIGGYDDSKVFEGFNAGRWNGWLIPAVTKEVWEDVIAWQKSLLTEEDEGLEEIIEDLESVEPNQEGLYLIGCGLIWDIVEDTEGENEPTKTIEISNDGWISVNGNSTKFNVVQRPWGTSLFQDNGKTAKPRYTEVDLPQERYSLTSDNPACGFGMSDFKADFLNILEGVA